eukprot:jgi/Mesen1/9459/ME000627S08849
MPQAKKKGPPGVGHTLIRRRFNRSKGFDNADPSRLHTEELEEADRPALQSIIDRNDLDELLYTAELADRDFTAERGNAQVILSSELAAAAGGLSKAEMAAQQRAEEARMMHALTIPRRPAWDSTTTAEQLDQLERASFLDWRRGLVSLEENEKLVLTPFEKNLDIWRQLWRVLERSDLMVMVVDVRNPLFYRCADLERYVKEINPCKSTMLLLNKADLLPVSVRAKWARYLTKQGIRHVFWRRASSTAASPPKRRLPSTTAATRRVDLNRCVVGFVGYPNVGKSSTVNALAGAKKTGVTSTPGKTKHFQTLILSDALMLCDSPGLVFPSFSSSRSEMVAAGVLPIDRMTEQRGPVEIVAEQIPRAVLEREYGIVLPQPAPHEPQDRPPTAAELLRAYARSRGYVAGSGLPDETRASRQILKDYLNGRLLYFHLPPADPDAASPLAHTSLAEDPEARGPRSTGAGGDEDIGDDEEWESDEEGEEGEERNEEEEDVGEVEDRAGQASSSARAGPSGRGGAEAGGEGAPGDEADTATVSLDTLRLIGDEELGGVRKESRRKSAAGLAHKMQKKAPRKKDRTWRVGHGSHDDSDGMPIKVLGVQRPVSHGAALRATVLPSQVSVIGAMDRTERTAPVQ